MRHNKKPVRRICVVWDFDNTLTIEDSTTQLVKALQSIDGDGPDAESFWKDITKITGKKADGSAKNVWDRILSSHTPAWMHLLGQYAYCKGIVLDEEGLPEFVETSTYTCAMRPYMKSMLTRIKDLSKTPNYKKSNIEIHHLIVSAGLSDLIQSIVDMNLFTSVFGGRYKGFKPKGAPRGLIPESIPVYCMDETMKTRALFEIAKGTFNVKGRMVNRRIPEDKYWCRFEDMIYIGDGPTDVPALALVRDRGGFGIVVHDTPLNKEKLAERFKDIAPDYRADAIVPAVFRGNSALFTTIVDQCNRIVAKYNATDFTSSLKKSPK